MASGRSRVLMKVDLEVTISRVRSVQFSSVQFSSVAGCSNSVRGSAGSNPPHSECVNLRVGAARARPWNRGERGERRDLTDGWRLARQRAGGVWNSGSMGVQIVVMYTNGVTGGSWSPGGRSRKRWQQKPPKRTHRGKRRFRNLIRSEVMKIIVYQKQIISLG